MPAQSPIYLILNGPPESGKSDVIAKGLMHRFRILNSAYGAEHPDYNPHEDHYFLHVVQDSFASPMKHFIATTLGVKYNELKKDTPMGILYGYSPREFLIYLSEQCIKPRYGDDFFGRSLVHRVLRIDPLPDIVLVDDGGFEFEKDACHPFARVVHITRPGKSYARDSRSYMENVDEKHLYKLDNNGTIEELQDKLDDLANWCLDQLPAHRRPPAIEE